MKSHGVGRTSNALAGLAAALAIFAAAPAFAQEAPTGSWSVVADGQGVPVQKTFSQGGSATDGTYLYVAGGLQEIAFNELNRFDPASATWTPLAPLALNDGTPYEVMDNTLVHHGGRLYCMGGLRFDTGAVSDMILVYDIATDTWSESAVMLPSARMQHGAAAFGDRIFVAGGLDSGFNATDSCDVFDPVAGTAGAVATLPVGANHMAMAATSTRLFAMGGFDVFGLITDAMYEYLPGDGSAGGDSWAVRSPMQDGSGNAMPRYSMRAFSLQDRVYVTGGINFNFERATLEYDPANDSWARRADMTDSRNHHAAASIGGQGFVFSGSGVASGEVYTPPDFGQEPPANTPPVADAGEDKVVNATSADGAQVALEGSGTDEDGDELTYSWSGPFGQASGATPTVTLALGSHELTLTVSDGTDQATDTVTITVADIAPPSLSGLCASPGVIKANNKKMNDVVVTCTATDDGDPAPVTEIVQVSSNQSDGVSPAWVITGAMTLQLRAERSHGETRVYTITVRSTDSSGNSSYGQVTVTVPANSGSDEAEAAGANNKK